MNKLYTIQLTALALALSTISLSVMAQGEHELELTGWQTPLAAEFSRLDTTGNGLLKPNEASKGNAFNKRTFAQADVDLVVIELAVCTRRNGELAGDRRGRADPVQGVEHRFLDVSALHQVGLLGTAGRRDLIEILQGASHAENVDLDRIGRIL